MSRQPDKYKVSDDLLATPPEMLWLWMCLVQRSGRIGGESIGKRIKSFLKLEYNVVKERPLSDLIIELIGFDNKHCKELGIKIASDLF